MKNIISRNTNPYVTLIIARFEFKEFILDYNEKLSDDVLSNAISALYYKMTPKLYVVEHLDGNWEPIAATNFLIALHQFTACESVYPVTGPAEELRGKTFSQLSRNTQRNLCETQLEMSRFDMIKDDNEKENAFREMVKITTLLA